MPKFLARDLVRYDIALKERFSKASPMQQRLNRQLYKNKLTIGTIRVYPLFRRMYSVGSIRLSWDGAI
jgi:hypothetical protein